MADHHFQYPVSPEAMNWPSLFPHFCTEDGRWSGREVQFADVGCGYGGLLVSLSPLFPDTLMLGMEIRVKVSEYVANRIQALRSSTSAQYQNIACVRTNAMKYLPNYFSKGQLTKMFFLYPDPHFKKCKYKWRIISDCLLAEYAFVLAVGGMLYTVTDVDELYEWIVTVIGRHALFRRIPDEQLIGDGICKAVLNCTEEGQKVTRNSGRKFIAVFERVASQGSR